MSVLQKDCRSERGIAEASPLQQTFHLLQVSQIRRDVEDAVVISFKIEDELRDTFAFEHGQFVTLRCCIDGKVICRSYSICSGVGEAEIRIGVRRVAGSRFSLWVNEALRVGDKVEILPPAGRCFFQIEPEARRRYLAVAAGSGITPILSSIRSVLQSEPASSFTLIYANRDWTSTMFLDELAQLEGAHGGRLTVHHILSRQKTELPARSGRLVEHEIRRLFDEVASPEDHDYVIVCGPEPVKDAVEAELAFRKFPVEQLYMERFGPPKRYLLSIDRSATV